MVSRSRIIKHIVACVGFVMLLSLVACGPGQGQVDVPLEVKNANNVGSLHIELAYDSVVLQATEVEAGKLARNAAIESNLGTPGLVVVAIVDATGINGDGSVVTVSFNVVGKGTSSLVLENVEANDAETLYDILTDVTAGSYQAEGNKVTAPLITFR